MKSKLFHLFPILGLTLLLAILPASRAQSDTPPDTTPSAPPPEKSIDDTKAAPGADAPAATEPVAAPEEPRAAVTPVDDTKKTEETSAPEGKKPRRMRTLGASNAHRSNNERVSFGHDSTLGADERADAVVSILGSSTSAGEVSDAVVSVFGNTRVTGGTVGDAAVSVLGSTYVNGHVHGEVVSVLGDVELGPDAVVDGEIVCVGGAVKRDAKAVTHGNVQHVAIGGRHFNFEKVQAWFTECLLYGRPLAFDANLMWAWCIALTFLGLYALLALVAPTGVMKCVATLEERPGYSILSGVLSLVLTPVAYLLLVLTIFIGIGFVLIPLFSLGLFFAAIFGKVVMLAWLGRRLTKLFGNGPLAHPVFAVLIGGAIVLGLYTVPIVGFIVYKLLGILGLGVVIYTLMLQYKASRPAPRPIPAASIPVAGVEPAPPVVVTLPPVISAATLPRVGFWLRLFASILDAVIVGMAFGMIHSLWRGFGGIFPFWFAVYCVIMWATKGTTIGGIICGLKLVRLDDRPVDWSVAIVRALSAFLSLAVAGLGFIWVAFDDERQSWHDKIAGTTIVRVPKGTPLL
ncbi:MAG: hypothetical protein JWQ83_1092 [Lacunisphaera sp.]|nr:hypothetical protein [Lacunisphaera sp.]